MAQPKPRRLPGEAEKLTAQQFADGGLTVLGVLAEDTDVLAFSTWLCRTDFALTLLGDAAEPGEFSIRRIWVPPALRSRGLASKGLAYAARPPAGSSPA